MYVCNVQYRCFFFFCTSLNSCFPDMLLRYKLNDLLKVPVGHLLLVSFLLLHHHHHHHQNSWQYNWYSPLGVVFHRMFRSHYQGFEWRVGNLCDGKFVVDGCNLHTEGGSLMYFFLRILPHKCREMVCIRTVYAFVNKKLLREKKVKIFLWQIERHTQACGRV
jgi:hypothetical protein